MMMEEVVARFVVAYHTLPGGPWSQTPGAWLMSSMGRDFNGFIQARKAGKGGDPEWHIMRHLLKIRALRKEIMDIETVCSVSVLGRQAARMFSGQFDETLVLQSLQARSASEAVSAQMQTPASAATQAQSQSVLVKGGNGPALPAAIRETKAPVSLQPADQQQWLTSEDTIALTQKALETGIDPSMLLLPFLEGTARFLRPQLAKLSKPHQRAPPGPSTFLLLPVLMNFTLSQTCFMAHLRILLISARGSFRNQRLLGKLRAAWLPTFEFASAQLLPCPSLALAVHMALPGMEHESTRWGFGFI